MISPLAQTLLRSSGKVLARGAGCDEARPQDETWITSLEGCGSWGQWTLPFALGLLWQDIDCIVQGLFPCFQRQQAVVGLCPARHMLSLLCHIHCHQSPKVVEQSENSDEMYHLHTQHLGQSPAGESCYQTLPFQPGHQTSAGHQTVKPHLSYSSHAAQKRWFRYILAGKMAFIATYRFLMAAAIQN